MMKYSRSNEAKTRQIHRALSPGAVLVFLARRKMNISYAEIAMCVNAPLKRIRQIVANVERNLKKISEDQVPVYSEIKSSDIIPLLDMNGEQLRSALIETAKARNLLKPNKSLMDMALSRKSREVQLHGGQNGR